MSDKVSSLFLSLPLRERRRINWTDHDYDFMRFFFSLLAHDEQINYAAMEYTSLIDEMTVPDL